MLAHAHYISFYYQVDVVQALIRDRVAIVNSPETGRDLEHCLLLIRKFEEFRTVSMRVLCNEYDVTCCTMCVCVYSVCL